MRKEDRTMGNKPLESLFNPRSIAVFGASESGRNVGSKLYANLTAGGFHGTIVPINPKYTTVGGRRCHAEIAAVGEEIDLAVIATPCETVPGIVAQCGAAGIRNAIILSAGFGEAGKEGRKLEAKLLDAAHDAGIRFLGPNCVGLVRPALGMNATFLKSAPPEGRLALVSQSGALCSAIADWAAPHHLGFSALVSLGNSANVDFGDVLQFLATDAGTDAILLYVEGIHNARGFISALRAAARLKPVIVLKSGHHARSAAAAATHTGALVGSDSVFDAVLERAGAIRVQTFGQLFAASEILSASRRVKGQRLGIITNGGGAGVLAADRAVDYHLELPAPSAATMEALDAALSSYWSHANPIDILGDATPDQYGTAVRAALADENFDGILVMLTPQAMTEATAAAQAVIDAIPTKTKKPVLACWMGETSVVEARRLLSAKGIADFHTPELAVEAFSYLAQHHQNRQLALEIPRPLSAVARVDPEGARLIIGAALSEGRAMLSDIEAKALLRSFGIPVNTTLEADSATKALIAAETVGFPVAMKINSPDISHKSDDGGVRLNITDAAEVKTAFRELTERVAAARPEATIEGVTIERMANARDTRELLVGVTRDPVFGPSIVFGAGGTMVEILRDSAVTLPPLTEVLANRLINRTRVASLLDTVRDKLAVDRDAVVDVLLKVSDLVCELPEISELDINPLLAGPNGVIAVDARVKVARPSAQAGPYDHMAIAPYPRHLEQTTHLADGIPLTIRPIRPEDADGIQTFVRELSPEARHFRFMGTLNELTPAMLSQLTQIDYHREMALVALTEENDTLTPQGVARYLINADETTCEFAIVVSDRCQGKGIGTRLMKALMDAAKKRGMTVIEGSVMTANRAMLKLMTELGFRITDYPDETDVVRVIHEL